MKEALAVIVRSDAIDAIRTGTLHVIARKTVNDATVATNLATLQRIAPRPTIAATVADKTEKIAASTAVKQPTCNAIVQKAQARHATSAKKSVIWHATAHKANRTTNAHATTAASPVTFHATAQNLD